MRIDLEPESLRPLIEMVVQQMLSEMGTIASKLDGRLSFPEAEAAELLGVERHVLRDARLRGEIEAAKVGKRVVYTPMQLREYLGRQRWEPE